MSFLGPGFLWVAAAAIAGVVIAHLFSRSRPRETVLPTARFIPEGPARAPSRARRPTDLLLLALRIAVAALVGAAFASPVFDAGRRSVARIFLVDDSFAIPEGVAADYIAGDAILAFDTTVRRVASFDSLDGGRRGVVRRGSLSLALAAAIREGAALAHSADSVEVVLVSPLTAEQADSATLALRALWPGRIRLVRAPLPVAAPRRVPVELRAEAGDPLRVAVELFATRSASSVRIVRGTVTPADSAWAAIAERVLVAWPAASPGGVSGQGVADVADTIGAVVAGGRVVVAPFERSRVAREGRVVARWADGVPAATEVRHGSGCIRTVAIPVSDAGDLVLRPEFGLLLAKLAAPCGGEHMTTPAAEAFIATMAGTGPLADARRLRGAAESEPRHAAWLLAAALAFALLEQLLRRRPPAPADAASAGRTAEASA